MNPTDIINTIQQHTGVNPHEARSIRPVVYTRYLCLYYISMLSGWSDEHSAKLFNMDRTTCTTARRAIRNGIAAGWAKKDVEQLNKVLIHERQRTL